MPQCPNPQLHVKVRLPDKRGQFWIRDDGRYGQYKSPFFLKLVEDRGGDTRAVLGGCNKRECYACQQNRALNWALKAYYESQMHQDSIFVTLTYDDQHLPPNGQLHYRDVKQFIDRLRSHLRYHGGPLIRYFYSGEYGERFGRPHYHLVIFGWKPDDLQPIGYSKNGDTRSSSLLLETLWKNGFVDVGKASVASMMYIANYIIGSSAELELFLTRDYESVVPGAFSFRPLFRDEKLERDDLIAQVKRDKMPLDLDTGELIERVPQGVRASNRPGLGRPWFDKYGREALKGFITIDGRKVPTPRNFANLVKAQFARDPDLEFLYRGEPTRLDELLVPDAQERERLMRYNHAVQYQKRIGAAYTL
jgi:hypothetical protein